MKLKRVFGIENKMLMGIFPVKRFVLKLKVEMTDEEAAAAELIGAIDYEMGIYRKPFFNLRSDNVNLPPIIAWILLGYPRSFTLGELRSINGVELKNQEFIPLYNTIGEVAENLKKAKDLIDTAQNSDYSIEI